MNEGSAFLKSFTRSTVNNSDRCAKLLYRTEFERNPFVIDMGLHIPEKSNDAILSANKKADRIFTSMLPALKIFCCRENSKHSAKEKHHFYIYETTLEESLPKTVKNPKKNANFDTKLAFFFDAEGERFDSCRKLI